MLTSISIKNFKCLDDVKIELGNAVVFVGPNNSGKTTALQALALWGIGLRTWNEKKKGRPPSEIRTAVAINRNSLIAIPIPDANLLWRGLHVREVTRTEGKQDTQNIRIDIIVQGISQGKEWECGLEFDYSNAESIYCRPIRLPGNDPLKKMTVPEEASQIKIAFLPPMSGLASTEPKWEVGRINVLLGEGQTAQVLRNLCYQIYESKDSKNDWNELNNHITNLFGVKLFPPRFIPERGEITMDYEEKNRLKLDISCSGRGLQQTLLLLSHLYAHPQTVLLLDEPDAHLEILRQRQIYQLLTDIAESNGSQIVAASHSEVILNEAADKNLVVAFVGKPHRIDDRGSQLLKSLKEIGFEQYYQAEEAGWVLYLEGSTDLSILKTFAKILNFTEAVTCLEKPFLYPVANQPQKARDHFFGLQEAKKDLVGIAIFDRLDKDLQQNPALVEMMWKKRELENYLCQEDILITYAQDVGSSDIFSASEKERRGNAMRESITEISSALKKLNKFLPWSDDIKASDDFLDPVFAEYFKKLNLPNILRKTNYHILARYVPKEKIDPEIFEKLKVIVSVAKKANPSGN